MTAGRHFRQPQFSCPKCKSGSTEVKDSRPAKVEGTWTRGRRRRCVACGFRFRTLEVVAGSTTAIAMRARGLTRVREALEAALKTVGQMEAASLLMADNPPKIVREPFQPFNLKSASHDTDD